MRTTSAFVMAIAFVLLLCVFDVAESWFGRRRRKRSAPPPDRSRPSLTCPPNIREHAESRQTYAWIVWDEPVAHDDRDGAITPHRNGPAPNSKFSGTTQIGYSATDRAGNHASCTFTITITVVHCTAPEGIDNGYFIYHPGTDWRYGGTSAYGCYRGYVLNGQNILECQIGDGVNGQWSAPTPSCQKMLCPSLPTIDRGRITCADNSRYESQCTYSCEQGYDIQAGVGRVRVCSHRGVWLGTEPTCVDVENPVWNSCPSNMIQYTNRGVTVATPTWLRPTAYDNSVEDILPILTEGFEPGTSTEAGTYRITYEATDSAGNSPPPCSFVINIRKVRCPRIYPTPYLVASCPNGYDWGDSCTFSCQDGYSLIGQARHNCEAPGTPPLPQWAYGLDMPSCEGQTCPALSAPGNGALICDLWLYGSFCKMFCNENYDVPRSRSRIGRDLFVCGQDTGQWNHRVPDCSRRRRSRRYNMNLVANYFAGDCCDASVQLLLQERFVDILTTHAQFSEACTLQGDGCSVDNTRVVCGPECPNADGRTKRSSENYYTSQHNRQKRSPEQFVLQIKATVTIPRPDLSDAEAYTEASGLFKTLVQNLHDSGDLNDLQLADVSTTLSSFDSGRAQVECDVGYEPTERGSCVGCKPGSYYDLELEECQLCPRGTYHDGISDNGCVSCVVGTTTARVGAQSGDECEDACPLGTFSSTGTAPCSPCMQGTFTEHLGTLVCVECPLGTYTPTVESTSHSDCQKYEITIVQSYDTPSYASVASLIGDVDVLAITFKLYMEHISGTSDIFTMHTSSVSVTVTLHEDMPLSFVANGCIYNSTEIATLISDNWNTVYFELNLADGRLSNFQLNAHAIDLVSDCGSLVPVQSENITILIGRLDEDADFSGKFTDVYVWNRSLNADELSLVNTECSPELHGATVSWNDWTHSQLIGASIQVPSHCDVADDCMTAPCGVHACVDGELSYHCNCYPGFTGLNCETNIDECFQHSCEESSTCVDGDNTYWCECPPDMRGRFCEFERVDGGWSEWGEWGACSASCEGGVQTQDRTCTQPVPGVEGRDCETESQQTQACNSHSCPVCSELIPPLNGQLDCHIAQPDYMNCTLVCDAGYVFSLEPQPYYFCDPHTTFYTWNFQADDNPNAQLPECTEVVAADGLAANHSVAYEDMFCSRRNYNAHRQTVLRNILSLGCISTGVCSWEMHVHNCDANERRGKRFAEPISFDLFIRINQDHISSNLTNEDVINVYDPLVDELEETATQVYSLIENGSFTVYVQDDVYYVAGQEFNPIITCPSDGMVYDDFYCMPCESGTFGYEGACHPCEYGSYQNETGQTQCEECPGGYITPGRESRSITECTVPCQNGTYGDNGECYPCNYGTYQNLTGQPQCEDCPNGYSTPGRGSSVITECTIELKVPTSSVSPQEDNSKDDVNLIPIISIVIALFFVIEVAGTIAIIVYLKMRKRDKASQKECTTDQKKYKSAPYSRNHSAKLTRSHIDSILAPTRRYEDVQYKQ